MNVSKHEQRTLHVLAQGGRIAYEKDGRGKIVEIICITREGWTLADCTPAIFHKLRRRGLIASRDGMPYRITREGLAAVRAQLDNR
ncbi:MAG TPA: YjhX family toxin [Azospirillaceae bacterium]|nr:YjhX family toxin [Azospirillaceae bacterium]